MMVTPALLCVGQAMDAHAPVRLFCGLLAWRPWLDNILLLDGNGLVV